MASGHGPPSFSLHLARQGRIPLQHLYPLHQLSWELLDLKVVEQSVQVPLSISIDILGFMTSPWAQFVGQPSRQQWLTQRPSTTSQAVPVYPSKRSSSSRWSRTTPSWVCQVSPWGASVFFFLFLALLASANEDIADHHVMVHYRL